MATALDSSTMPELNLAAEEATIQEIVSQMRDHETPIEVLDSALARGIEVIKRINLQVMALVQDTRMDVKQVLANSVRTVDMMVDLRNAGLDAVRERAADMRKAVDGEVSFIAYLRDMGQREGLSEAEIIQKIQGLNAQGQQKRHEVLVPLMTFADRLLALQSEMDLSVQITGDGTTTQRQLPTVRQEQFFVDWVQGVRSHGAKEISDDDVDQYLTSLDDDQVAAAYGRILDAIESMPADFRAMYSGKLPTYRDFLLAMSEKRRDQQTEKHTIHRLLVGAAIGERVEGLEPDAECWLDILRKLDEVRGYILDVCTDTGSRALLQIQSPDHVEVLRGHLPTRYPTQNVLEGLELEQDTDYVDVPNSKPLFVHKYKLSEIRESLQRLPEGLTVDFMLVFPENEREAEKVELVRDGNGIRYVTPQSYYPLVEELLEHPGRHIIPMSLTFTFNQLLDLEPSKTAYVQPAARETE